MNPGRLPDEAVPRPLLPPQVSGTRMTHEARNAPIAMALSHLELYVHDVERMEAFYLDCLGFVVTDRGEGPDALVFMSSNPGEHHQLVLNPRPARSPAQMRVDHIAFRVASLAHVRAVHSALASCPDASAEAVSHGTTWSLYFRDPEGNRLEVFADTPWHVSQPCKFPVDLRLVDDELHAYTVARIRDLPGFRPAAEWKESHLLAMGGRDGQSAT